MKQSLLFSESIQIPIEFIIYYNDVVLFEIKDCAN